MPFIGNKPSAVPLTSADITDNVITSAKIVDSTIVNADIANSTINLTQKVTGALPVANGGTGLTALGTANQELRVNSGATALEYYTPTVASSDYVLLATTDITTSTASVSFDGYFSSTYKNYKIIASHVTGSGTGISTGVYFSIRYRRSNADVSASSYRSQLVWSYNCDSDESSVSQSGSEKNVNRGLLTFYDLSNTTAKSINSEIILYDPLGTTNYKYTNVQSSYFSSFCGHNSLHHLTGTTVLEDNANALSGITFRFTSGNITNGNFKLYGIK